jgi:hypothetical protein
MNQHFNACFTRRTGLLGAFAMAAAARTSRSQAPTSSCPRCHGLGRLPLKDARPWVWLEPAATPKWDSIIDEQPCPACQTNSEKTTFASELQGQFETAQENHRRWETRTDWKLTLAVTRHATLHSQLTTAQTRNAAAALETLTLHLKRVTGSLALAATRPDTLELMLLLERPSWDKFRVCMESLYTREQLGESWAPARDLNAYDHFAIPHFYETRETIRARPPSCAVTFIVARRQLHQAAGGNAPFWLTEGFAAYGDYVVHKVNRWYTTYAGKSVAPGDWMKNARKRAADTQHRDWPDMLRRELRDWTDRDHYQTMSMAAFLLESEPAKFIDYLHRLATAQDSTPALETAYSATLADLESRWLRWLLARK